MGGTRMERSEINDHTKYFRSVGILNTDLDVITLNEEDPFQNIDEDVEMSSLISRTMGTLHQCSVEEYVNGDNSLSVCVDMDDNGMQAF